MATHAAAHGGKTGREPGSDAKQRGLPWPGAVTPRSTTRPLDYALLEGAFLTCFIGVVALARRREGCDALAIASSELPVMAMAVFALTYGVFYGGFVAILPTLVMDFFGGRNVSGIIGVLYTSIAFGTLVGPSAAGFAFDVSHSYTVPILIGVGANLIAALILAVMSKAAP